MASSTEKLIEVIKKFPILFDLNHPDFKNIRKKDKVWDEIGQELEGNGEEFKKKWKNLRDSYAKFIRSTKTKTGQAAKRSYANWQWSKQMETFRPYLTFAKTESNIRDINEEENDIQNKSQFTETEAEEGVLHTEQYENIESPNVSSPAEIIQNQDIQTTAASVTPSTKQSLLKNTQLRRRRRTSNTQDETPKVSSVEQIVTYLENKRQRTDTTANDLIFSGYAKTVNSFSGKRQAITRMKIAQIISEQELAHLEENQPSSSNSTSNASANSVSHFSTETATQFIDLDNQSNFVFDYQPENSSTYLQ